MADTKLLQQVSDQCRVVAHLATALAQVHSDYATMLADEQCSKQVQDIADQCGKRSAAFMEQLGDMLNAMDAASDDDEWTQPIFREAQKRWPTTGDGSR